MTVITSRNRILLSTQEMNRLKLSINKGHWTLMTKTIIVIKNWVVNHQQQPVEQVSATSSLFRRRAHNKYQTKPSKVSYSTILKKFNSHKSLSTSMAKIFMVLKLSSHQQPKLSQANFWITYSHFWPYLKLIWKKVR